jgi:hypothetical protein
MKKRRTRKILKYRRHSKNRVTRALGFSDSSDVTKQSVKKTNQNIIDSNRKPASMRTGKEWDE